MASPQALEKYDTALLGILQHVGELEPFLDVLFGFLFRKTDFYHIRDELQMKYGFPEGVAKKIIEKYFNKYSQITAKLVAAQREKEAAQQTEVAKIEEVESEPSAPKDPETTEPNPPAAAKSVEVKDEPPKTQEAFQSNPDSYNGAVRDRYSWSQNYEDLDIVIPVDKTVTKTNQIKVEVRKKSLLVAITKDDGTVDTIIDGELSHEVRWTESSWSLEKGKCLTISISKDVNFWFKALLTDEEEIDLKKITPERPMTDMAPDELAVINKLQFDEKQKRLGLPQSHELKVHEMLKKGWDAEGSPFKGQEFDPKMFNISPSSCQ